ncbi:MAG: enolase C-terminal domain-like protein [Kofleriaceae bacterium]
MSVGGGGSIELVAAELREVRWPLAPVGAAGRRTHAWRRAGLVRVRVRTGDVAGLGLGEAAALAGSAEAELREHEVAMDELRRWVAAPRAAASSAAECAARAEAAAPRSPAARFAIESALLDALASARGVAVADLLHAAPAPRVAVNAVVADLASARAAARRGIRTFKLKLGLETDDDARLLAELRRELGGDARLRGDANGCWPVDEVGARLRALAGAGLEYVEEPCADLPAALRGGASWAIPVALDESLGVLAAAEVAELARHPALAALILKPTRLGGFAPCLALARAAAAAGKAAIVTHALEGPVAMAGCAELARALAPLQRAAPAVGVDLHPGLAAWPLRPPQHDACALRAAPDAGLGLAARWDELTPTPGTDEVSP